MASGAATRRLPSTGEPMVRRRLASVPDALPALEGCLAERLILAMLVSAASALDFWCEHSSFYRHGDLLAIAQFGVLAFACLRVPGLRLIPSSNAHLSWSISICGRGAKATTCADCWRVCRARKRKRPSESDPPALGVSVRSVR